MTKFEKIAMNNIRNCFNYEIGGLYNAYIDGAEIEYPTITEMKESIYSLSIKHRYGDGSCFFNCAPKEMRFAGKEFCKNYINRLFEKSKNDTDIKEIPWKEEA